MTKGPRTTRRERVPPPADSSGPAVFVVRRPAPSKLFSWEIRRLSAVVLARSDDGHPSPEAARKAGFAALRAMSREEVGAGRGPIVETPPKCDAPRPRGRPRNA